MFDLFANNFSLGSVFWGILTFYVHVSANQQTDWQTELNIYILLDISAALVKVGKEVGLVRSDTVPYWE